MRGSGLSEASPGPGRGELETWLDLSNQSEVTDVGRNECEPLLSGGGSNETVVQEAPAEAARALEPTLNESGKDEGGPHPGRGGWA